MKDLKIDKEAIKEKAYELNRWYTEAPIPVYEICQDLGVDVYIKDFEEIEDNYRGFSDFKNWNINLNQKNKDVVNNFTTAYCLGQLIAYRKERAEDGERFMFCHYATEVDEFTYFALHLLMPDSLLKGITEESKRAANLFNVSRIKLAMRLSNG